SEDKYLITAILILSLVILSLIYLGVKYVEKYEIKSTIYLENQYNLGEESWNLTIIENGQERSIRGTGHEKITAIGSEISVTIVYDEPIENSCLIVFEGPSEEFRDGKKTLGIDCEDGTIQSVSVEQNASSYCCGPICCFVVCILVFTFKDKI
ncbi:MAG: hypothetical protein CMB73_07620, partial [Euryarchaeota archaeon]|nr:hypothetical protein [Euryarchaeota archaeon]